MRCGTSELSVSVYERQPEYGRLSRNEALLKDIATRTGGTYTDVGNVAGLIPDLRGKESRETASYVFHAWRHWLTLALIAGLLTSEWIVRKWVGKI
jgi:hypothetical protein